MVAEDAALALLAEAGDGSMRDALSIMDQAIASAPVENGKAVLSAAQIRELMGSVPNAVFERLLEAVAAGQSAELMEQLNLLVNAGHNPSSLARQMVRYLRNALMAKLGGEQTELLQISGDERARAARTALLFTEEELTRNLQIVLRTFDDLNYRQEQRFHLELGLLKLIHAQRLLPIEELLSGVASCATIASSLQLQPQLPRSTAKPGASDGILCAASSSISFAFWLAGTSWSSGPKSATSVPSLLWIPPPSRPQRICRPQPWSRSAGCFAQFVRKRHALPCCRPRPPGTSRTSPKARWPRLRRYRRSSQHRIHPPRRGMRAGRGRSRIGGAVAGRGHVDAWMAPACASKSPAWARR